MTVQLLIVPLTNYHNPTIQMLVCRRYKSVHTVYPTFDAA